MQWFFWKYFEMHDLKTHIENILNCWEQACSRRLSTDYNDNDTGWQQQCHTTDNSSASFFPDHWILSRSCISGILLRPLHFYFYKIIYQVNSFKTIGFFQDHSSIDFFQYHCILSRSFIRWILARPMDSFMPNDHLNSFKTIGFFQDHLSVNFFEDHLSVDRGEFQVR